MEPSEALPTANTVSAAAAPEDDPHAPIDAAGNCIDLELLSRRLMRPVQFTGTTSEPMSAAAAAAPKGVIRWIVDSGASNHMVCRKAVDP